MNLRPRCPSASSSGPRGYYPILKRHGKALYLKDITKKDTHATPSNFEQIRQVQSAITESYSNFCLIQRKEL